MGLLRIIAYAYLLLKPYYFFQSGSLQISDAILVIGFIVYLLGNKGKGYIRKEAKDNIDFIIFVILASIINLIYFIGLSNKSFILSSLYLLFNVMSMLIFVTLIKNEKFKNNFRKILKTNLVLQLILWVLNVGKYFSATRYMGSFNDPNQFAFYVLISYSFIYILSNKKYGWNNMLFLAISTLLIIQSASTGMLFGLMLFIVLFILFIIKNLKSILKTYKYHIIVFTIFIIPITLGVATMMSNNIKVSSMPIASRIQDKISRIKVDNSSTTTTLWEERSYDKIIYYPKYILYGSGAGEFERFSKAHHTGEIHATLPALLFYYGIIPFFFLIKWIYKKLKGVHYGLLIPVIIIIAESFTLANQRQALFWILIAIVSIIQTKEMTRNEK